MVLDCWWMLSNPLASHHQIYEQDFFLREKGMFLPEKMLTVLLPYFQAFDINNSVCRLHVLIGVSTEESGHLFAQPKFIYYFNLHKWIYYIAVPCAVYYHATLQLPYCPG